MSIPKMLTCDTFPGFLSFCPSNFFPRFLQWPSLCVAPSIFCPVFFCGQGHVYCSPVVFGHVGVDVMAVALCSTLAFSGLHRDVPSRNPVSSFVSSFSSSFFSCLQLGGCAISLRRSIQQASFFFPLLLCMFVSICKVTQEASNKQGFNFV